jgi:hypothetical protein
MTLLWDWSENLFWEFNCKVTLVTAISIYAEV